MSVGGGAYTGMMWRVLNLKSDNRESTIKIRYLIIIIKKIDMTGGVPKPVKQIDDKISFRQLGKIFSDVSIHPPLSMTIPCAPGVPATDFLTSNPSSSKRYILM